MPTQDYKEQNFEDHIESHLLASGYHRCIPADYDKSLCLIPAELLAFIQASQPDAYAELEKQFGRHTAARLCQRLAQEVDRRGTLDVLRQGLKTRGVKFDLYYRRPANQMNPDHWQKYSQNRFSVVRQLQYSQKTGDEIDLALFLNGLPIVTAELKNSLTGQFVANAVKQYKQDRLPKGEPFLKYKRCLAHFALGNEQAFMTTHLQGDQTRFFPFNLDSENPANPYGHKTAYLWQDIWQPDILLLLISNYLHLQKNSERVYDAQQGNVVEVTSEAFIFPRYHQLDVVRQLLAAVRQEGAGANYLVQHSAGSGKSNSIAWLAHQLANRYQRPTDKERLFDSIIVVTDRRVLDSQLQNTIKQFEQTAGLVVAVDKHSGQLKEALEKGKAIIVTTLQKFPVISATTAALKGQKFAVIIDEAHSSQSGESAKHLKQTLSPVGAVREPPLPDDEEFDLEDAIVHEIRLRGRQAHISYFAFTATPKNKTLELFGRQTPDGEFVAFHNYWMRQAIAEGFILDVLKNYTTFERYFKLVKKIEGDKEYEKRKALTLLKSYVDLQPHAIEMKTRIMLEHFVSVTANAIRGRGRAMVATQSKEAAIRYWQAFRQQMKEMNLPYKPLVAFTGKVRDAAGEEYTEASANNLPPKVSIPDAFKTPEYRILIVVDKYQTGFDEPMLHTMYVDKKLRDVNAVQTLSRLNRTMSGKTNTVVLDFVNTAADILAAFQPYYQTTLLEEETEPDKLYDLQRDLAGREVYSHEDVDDFAAVFFNPAEPGEKLQPILDSVVNAWKQKPQKDREAFRSTLRKFIRFYGFVAQLITFADPDLEKLYAFARHLNRKLPRRDNRLPYEIRDAVDLDSFRIEETYKGNIALLEQDAAIPGLSAAPGASLEDEQELLSVIIQLLNDTFGVNITDEDKVDMGAMKQKLFSHEALAAAMTADNSLANMQAKFNQLFDQMLLEFVHNKLELYKKLSEPNVNQQLKRHWFDGAFRYFHGGSR
jgi:type I restriction enzyme R subunit